MFKQIAERLLPSNRHIVRKIRLHYGPILEIENCQVITFFMPPRLEWEGSLNNEVLSLAGRRLDDHIIEKIERPAPGTVHCLPSFDMTDRQALFMAVLPEWDGGIDFEDNILLRCYRGAIEQAQRMGFKSIAFPAMGKDKRDFPHIRFARLAIQGIMERLDERMDEVIIACADQRMYDTYKDRLKKMGWREPPANA